MNSVVLNGKKVVPTKVVCIGKNYAAHVKEMGGDRPPDEPTIFLKPNSAIALGIGEVHVPGSLGLVHHEVELCFMVGRTVRSAGEAAAKDAISAFAVGIDLTLRDMQSKAKAAGGPWSISKGFDSAAVFGEFVKAAGVDPMPSRISLKLNGSLKQDARTGDMIFRPEEMLSYVSRFMTIEEGDVFMCGTPEGVGPLIDGDVVEAEIEGLPALHFRVDRRG